MNALLCEPVVHHELTIVEVFKRIAPNKMPPVTHRQVVQNRSRIKHNTMNIMYTIYTIDSVNAILATRSIHFANKYLCQVVDSVNLRGICND